MDVTTFAEIQPEFMARISQAVYCSMTTVDQHNRPRSRILHPIWDGYIGWAISWPQSHKARHLAYNPHVALAYIQDSGKPVYADCTAAWIADPVEKQRIWDLYRTTDPPLGFDPQPHYASIHDKYFGLLKFTPWRIELANLQGESRIWRQK